MEDSTTMIDHEFTNITEVTNDLLHKLNVKDIILLRSLTLDQFILTQPHFVRHIESFYMIWDANSQIVKNNPGRTSKQIAQDIAEDIWKIINRTVTPQLA
jgi:hypothetical protein